MSTLREDRKLIPKKTYDNAASLKKLIFADNRGLSGIYRWINKINKKTYVGSGKDLAKRLAIYYKTSELIKYKRPIHQALLKYGYENFYLEILEYCTSDELIKREQYFIDLLEPEYNILKIAYSLAGFKHSKESIAIQKAKAILDRGVAVWVWNRETDEKLVFPTQFEAGEYLGISSTWVRNAIRKGNFIKNLYLLSNNEDENFSDLAIRELRKTSIKVLNIQTKEERVFYSQSEVAEFLGVTRSAISMGIKFNNTVKDIYLITNKATFSAEALGNANTLKVLNIQTNEIRNFIKQTEVAKFLGVSASTVTQAIKAGRKIKDVYLISKESGC
jgi:predicted transcriptional regulator